MREHPVTQTILKLVIYSSVLALVAHLIYLDAFQQDVLVKFSESTYTEWSQVGCLVLMILFFLGAAIIDQAGQRLSILMIGATVVALIREFNNFFNDQVFDGAWQTLAVVAAVTTGWIYHRYTGSFKIPFTRFIQSSSCGVMMAGFITTFVFSRLFGRTIFWQAVMEEQYFRSVKNAAEEGIELLGYGLMLLGAIEYFYYTLKRKNRSEIGGSSFAGKI